MVEVASIILSQQDKLIIFHVQIHWKIETHGTGKGWFIHTHSMAMAMAMTNRTFSVFLSHAHALHSSIASVVLILA